MIIAVVAVVAVALLFTAYQTFRFGSNYNKAVAAELPDKCATPPGYTDAAWREHMGHHPDRYAECLNK